jgi:peptidoglycan/LPS O-acetylase OafA/YrhL
LIKNKRNGKVEFLRLVFCILLVIFHGKNTMDDGQIRIVFSGRLGVEFFYLVSGYLMAVSLAKIRSSGSTLSIGRETGRFLLRKIKVLYPMVVIAFFMTMFASFMAEPTSFESGLLKIIKGVPNLFLIQQTGIQFYTVNGTWYISSMLIAMAILYPICLKHYEFMRRIGVGLIAFLLIGYMMQMTKGLGSPTAILHDITYRGNIRALSEIALGMLCYEGAMYLRTVPFKKLGRIFLLLVEITVYAISIVYIIFHEASKYDYFVLLLLAIGVTLSFSECNYCRKLWDKPIFAFAGKASLYIYLAHVSFARDLTFIVGESANNKVRMIVFLILVVFATAFLWLTSIGWRKISRKVYSMFVELKKEQ